MQTATRENLVAFIFGILLISLGPIGAAAGMSIVPYWSGGWDLVIKTWKVVGKPVEPLSAILGLVGLISGFALGYGIARVLVLVTGLASYDEVRDNDRHLWELMKYGWHRPKTARADQQQSTPLGRSNKDS